MEFKFDSVESALESMKNGEFIVVVDDENRENEGDLVIAAEKATSSRVNFMITHGKGLVCVPMEGKKLDELKISLMVPEDENTEPTKCAFTVSVDYKKGTTTGISAFDRSETIKALINPESKPDDFHKPGHIFPLRAKEGGVLERPGHTEAAIDLMKLANLYPATVIVEIIKENGEMARLPELFKFAEKHKMKIITIKELEEYLKST